MFRGLRSVYSRYNLHVHGAAKTALYIEGSNDFVTFIVASIATRWSEPVPGWVYPPLKSTGLSRRTVTAKSNGSYVNMLSACSLQTDKGCNSGAFSAVFTVGIKLSKTFSPARIGVGGVSLLTITLHNPGSSVASMIAPLTDKLPSGLTVSGNIRNSCGGTVTAPTGGSTVTLTGGSIPARSLCSITVNVTAAYPDCYYNMLPSGALQTNEGSNTAPYVASVTVN